MSAQIKHIEIKLKNIVYYSIKQGKYDKALAAISASANIYYHWNQKYIDIDLENYIIEIADALIDIKNINFTKSNTIVFYDGIGLNTRGLATIYLTALGKTGYKIIYLISDKSKNNQPEIDKILQKFNIKKMVYTTSSHVDKIIELDKIIKIYNPLYMFFYTNPNDAAGACVFTAYDKLVRRFQINLTDHAYWLGTNTFDYCIEFRDYGASISNRYRKIPKEKIAILPYYPYYDPNFKFKGFPFDPSNKKIVFSGGSLYKTLGDPNNTYYNILDTVLKIKENVVFLYAGNGDSSELDKLAQKYPKRVYHIDERKDLYQLLQHCTLYLNTYPMLGGLMTQYAAIAGKIPVTLMKKNDISSGLLIAQEKREIEYTDPNELISDICKLLTDSDYLAHREELLGGSVISEDDFRRNLESIMLTGKSQFVPRFDEYDNKSFLAGYIKRFDYEKVLMLSIATKINKSLLFNFPMLFLKKLLLKFLIRKN